MADGMGCTCAAWSENECCCGVDWTSQREIDLRNELETVKSGLAARTKQAAEVTLKWRELQGELTTLRQKIDNLEPVAWKGITGDYGFIFLSFQEQPGMTPLYSLEGIKQ